MREREPWAWELERGKKTWRVPPRGPVTTNNFELMRMLAVAGVAFYDRALEARGRALRGVAARAADRATRRRVLASGLEVGTAVREGSFGGSELRKARRFDRAAAPFTNPSFRRLKSVRNADVGECDVVCGPGVLQETSGEEAGEVDRNRRMHIERPVTAWRPLRRGRTSLAERRYLTISLNRYCLDAKRAVFEGEMVLLRRTDRAARMQLIAGRTAALETLVFHEIRVHNLVAAKHRPIAYYRTSAGAEIDFVIESRKAAGRQPAASRMRGSQACAALATKMGAVDPRSRGSRECGNRAHGRRLYRRA